MRIINVFLFIFIDFDENYANSMVKEKIKVIQMQLKKVVQSTETQSFNKETGEVETHNKNTVYSFPKEPPYIKLYLDDIEALYHLPNNSSTVLFELLKQLNYNGLIPLNSTTKKMISDATGYKVASIDNYLTKLCSKGIFIREGRGVFRPDPHLFGRGEWKDIYSMREGWLKVTYKDGKREVETNFSEENKQA